MSRSHPKTSVRFRSDFTPRKTAAFAVSQPSAQAMTRTVIMFAAPQIGKTGAYLYCCLAARELISMSSHKLAINLAYRNQVTLQSFRRTKLNGLKPFLDEVNIWVQEQHEEKSPPLSLKRKLGQLIEGEGEVEHRAALGQESRVYSCYFHCERADLLPIEWEEKVQDASKSGLAAVIDRPQLLTDRHLAALRDNPLLRTHSIIYVFGGDERDNMRSRLPCVPLLSTRPSPSPIHTEMKQLHRKYYKENSEKLHRLFEERPELWTQYHNLIEESQADHGMSITQQFAQLWFSSVTDDDEQSDNEVIEVGDMGCGRCQLAKELLHIVRSSSSGNVRVEAGQSRVGSDTAPFIIRVKGVDHQTDEKSTQLGAVRSNMRHTAWENNKLNVIVCCLSLWGSDRHTYIKEAYRVLKKDGKLFIVETKYRMDIDRRHVPEEITKKCNQFALAICERGFAYLGEFMPEKFLGTRFVCQQFIKIKPDNRGRLIERQDSTLDFPSRDDSGEDIVMME